MSGLLLVRLLTPDNFGLMAVVTVVLDSLQIFQDIGLKQTLIVRNVNDDQTLNAAFYMSLGMSILLLGLVLLLSPLLASFFNERGVVSLLNLVSTRLLVGSLSTVPSAILEKELRFRTLALAGFFGALIFAAISIPLAAAGFGAWSLAWGTIAQALLRTCWLWRCSSWKPSPGFDRYAAVSLFSYSKHIVINSLGTFLHRNLDTIMVGKILGMSTLGYYNQAFSLANTPPTLIMSVLAPIILPTYSMTQQDAKRLTNLHLRFIKYLFILLVPFSIVAAVLGREIVLVLYGAKWEGAVLPFQILGTYAVLRQAAGTNGPMLMILNRVRVWNYVIYLTLFLLGFLAWPAMKWRGLLGMSVLMCIIAFFNWGLATVLTTRGLKLPFTNVLRLYVVPTFAATVSLFVLLVFNTMPMLQVTNYGTECLLANLFRLACKGTSIAVCYGSILCLVDREIRADLWSWLLSLRVRKLNSVWHE